MNKLTKYEIAQIIGKRSMQISMGAPSTINIDGLTNAMQIAEKEFKERKIPLIIIRTMPSGEKVEFSIYED